MAINNASELLKLMENNTYVRSNTQEIFEQTITGEYCLPINVNNIPIQIDLIKLIVRESYQLNWLQYAYLLRYLTLNNPIIAASIIHQGCKYGNKSLLFQKCLDHEFISQLWYHFYCAHRDYLHEIFFKRNNFSRNYGDRKDIFFTKLIDELVDYLKYVDTDFVSKERIYEHYKESDDIVHTAEYEFYNINNR